MEAEKHMFCTREQRRILRLGAVLVLLMLVFPPYYVERVEGNPVLNNPPSHVVVSRSGIGFIFNMPEHGATIHTSVLLIEVLGATIAAAFAFVAAQRREAAGADSRAAIAPPPAPRSAP